MNPIDQELKPLGVSRMADNEKAYLVSFSRPLDDDELRDLHEFLRGWIWQGWDRERHPASDLSAPPGDSKPSVPLRSWNISRLGEITEITGSSFYDSEGKLVRAQKGAIVDGLELTEDTDYTLPADSIEKAIGELPEGWIINQWELHLGGPDNAYRNVQGPTPLSAIRAAMEKINP